MDPLINISDDLSKNIDGLKTKINKIRPEGQILIAVVSDNDGSRHTLSLKNPDGSFGPQEYQNIVSIDGSTYDVGTTVQIYFPRVSPLPRIIGGAGASAPGDDFLPIVVSRLGFNG
jgi:hypothetical protein